MINLDFVVATGRLLSPTTRRHRFSRKLSSLFGRWACEMAS